MDTNGGSGEGEAVVLIVIHIIDYHSTLILNLCQQSLAAFFLFINQILD